MQRHRRGLGDHAVLRPQERLGQIVRGRHRRGPPEPGPAAVPAVQRGLPGLGVGAAVVLGFDPRGQQPVERQQRGAVISTGGDQVLGGGVGDLDEELFAHGPEEPFDLAAALWPVRGGMHQADPEFGACPQQPGIDERRPVVDIHAGRDPAGGQRRLQRHPKADGVLGETEPVATDQPRMIVEEREQIGLAATNLRAVQRIAGPTVIRVLGFEAPEHRWGVPGGRADQLTPVKVAQQRRLRR